MTIKIHTMEECRKQGADHAGYGWAPKPWGHWSAEQRAAYAEGFADASGGMTDAIKALCSR